MAEPREAGVQVHRAGFDQAVGTEQDGLPRVEAEPGDPVLLVRRDPERQPAGHRLDGRAAVHPPDHRVEVTGPHRVDHAVVDVDLRVGAGREVVGVQVREEAGGPGHHGGRRVALGRVRAQGDPQLAHDPGGVHVMALDVADHQPDVPAGQRHHVVPVAADLEARPGRQVADGGGDPGDRRDGARQHHPLQAGRQLVLGVVQPGAGQRLRDQAAQGGEQGALVGVQLTVVVEADQADPDRPAAGDQRQEGPGAAGNPAGRPPGLREPLAVLVTAGDEHGCAQPDRLGGGVPGRQQRAVVDGQLVRLVAAGAEDLQAPRLLRGQHQAVRRQARQRELGEDPGDVLDRDGLGERAGGLLDEARAVLAQHRHPVGPVAFVQLDGGVPDEADHPGGPAEGVRQDAAAEAHGPHRALRAHRAVVRAALAQLGDGPLDAAAHHRRVLGVQQPQEGRRGVVEPALLHAEDGAGPLVALQDVAADVPVERADAVGGHRRFEPVRGGVAGRRGQAARHHRREPPGRQTLRGAQGIPADRLSGRPSAAGPGRGRTGRGPRHLWLGLCGHAAPAAVVPSRPGGTA